jgi:hypothetical protein
VCLAGGLDYCTGLVLCSPRDNCVYLYIINNEISYLTVMHEFQNASRCHSNSEINIETQLLNCMFRSLDLKAGKAFFSPAFQMYTLCHILSAHATISVGQFLVKVHDI